MRRSLQLLFFICLLGIGGCDSTTPQVEDDIPVSLSGKVVFTAWLGDSAALFIGEFPDLGNTATQLETKDAQPRDPHFGQNSNTIYHINHHGGVDPHGALWKLNVETRQDSLLEKLSLNPGYREYIFPLMYSFEEVGDLGSLIFVELNSPGYGFRPRIRLMNLLTGETRDIANRLFAGYQASGSILAWDPNSPIDHFEQISLSGSLEGSIPLQIEQPYLTVQSAEWSEKQQSIVFSYRTEDNGPARSAILNVGTDSVVFIPYSDPLSSDFYPKWGSGNSVLFLRDTSHKDYPYNASLEMYSLDDRVITTVLSPSRMKNAIPRGIGLFDFIEE